MKIDILALRKRAESELRVLFNKPITEENIMYLVGLYMTGVDTVSIAINMMNLDEWGKMHPSYPEADEPEDSEELKAQKIWEKRTRL